MEIVLLSLAAFFVAILTFFSGFGLGTILITFIHVIFPVEWQCLNRVVHFSIIFSIVTYVGKKADKKVLIRFGIRPFLQHSQEPGLLLQITVCCRCFPSIWEQEF